MNHRICQRMMNRRFLINVLAIPKLQVSAAAFSRFDLSTVLLV
jgi:hypothetical protein